MGVISIRNKVVGEIMHNPVGPWAEANALYIEGSRLAEKFAKDQNPVKFCNEVVVFDVGLGAAANALAALHCHRYSQNRRPLRLISFERDIELLSFALANAEKFPHFRGYEAAIQCLLEHKVWREDDVVWELREGDFLQTIENEKHLAEVIFFDPYSPKVNREMWSTECFSRLRSKCALDPDRKTMLYTYSQSTSIRTAMLLAGFYVGIGAPTGLKETTTQAAINKNDLSEPLSRSWLEKWLRSHARFPFESSELEHEKITDFMLKHPQFV